MTKCPHVQLEFGLPEILSVLPIAQTNNIQNMLKHIVCKSIRPDDFDSTIQAEALDPVLK